MDISQRLSKINASTGRHFQVVSNCLIDQLGPHEYVSWASLCLDIANCGWHSYEATDEYLKLSQLLLEKKEKAKITFSSGILECLECYKLLMNSRCFCQSL